MQWSNKEILAPLGIEKGSDQHRKHQHHQHLLAPTSNYKKSQPKPNTSRQLYLSRPEPKEWIISAQVNPAVRGVKYYHNKRPGGYQTESSHQ